MTISSFSNLPSRIDPIAVVLGGVDIRWYGLCWIAGFAVVTWLLMVRHRRGELPMRMTRDDIVDLALWSLVGALVGGRLGYVVLYERVYFAANPLAIVMPFSDGVFTGIAGMSFHGALVGVAVVWWVMARHLRLRLLTLADAVVPAIPFGYALGRIGNFLNGELYGRPTGGSWGMYFPAAPDGGQILRHPSQLYEACGEGLVLGAVLWLLRRRFPDGSGIVSGVFLVGYGTVRFGIEVLRAPDAQMGILAAGLTMGQWLCLGMVGIGGIIAVRGIRHITPRR